MSFKFFKLKTFLGRRVIGYFKEVYTHLKTFFLPENKPEKKFIIFSSGRSGSTLLVSLINSNPNIFCDGEILNRRVFDQKKLIRAHEKNSSNKVFGFKLLTYQLQFTQNLKNPKQFIESLYDDGFEVIYLLRQNIVRQALSILYAESRNKWHQESSPQGKRYRMKVDVTALVKKVEELEQSIKDESEYLSDIPHIKITYEDDLEKSESHEKTMKLIFDFLGEEYSAPSTTLRKISSSDISSFVENHIEAKATISKTRFKHLL